MQNAFKPVLVERYFMCLTGQMSLNILFFHKVTDVDIKQE